MSGDLKYALRHSIELLGNEAIHWRRSRNEGVFTGKPHADQLTLESLRYMYRLLFLFYIESRPDLGYAPMGSDVYRLGYSLESLRDMDTAELGSEEDKESTYISDSLDRLFQMIWEGYPKRDDESAQLPLADADDPFHDSFRLTPLKAHLFDPARMPTLTRVRFRNVVLREVIELMSLTREGKGKRCINDRTTEETRAWATAVLHDLEFDDLDGGSDPSSDYRSLLHGDHPLVEGFEDPAEEQRFLVSTLRQLRDEQQSLASTCVAARTNKAVEKLEVLLKGEGFATRVIDDDESDDPSDPALRLATMHRVKGLEFDQVFLPGLDATQMPLQVEVNKRPDALSRDLFEQQERSLLHVAATRAKKRVVVSYSGKASPFLDTR